MAEEKERDSVAVLVVDDSSAVRQSLGRFLSEQGYAVQMEHDGQAGLDALRQELPDVLLLDTTCHGSTDWKCSS